MALALFSPRLRFAKSVARIDSPRREQYNKGATVPVAGGGSNACKTVGLVCFTTTARCARDLDCEAAVNVANSPFQHDTASCRWQYGKHTARRESTGSATRRGARWTRSTPSGSVHGKHSDARAPARTHTVSHTVSHAQCHTHSVTHTQHTPKREKTIHAW